MGDKYDEEKRKELMGRVTDLVFFDEVTSISNETYEQVIEDCRAKMLEKCAEKLSDEIDAKIKSELFDKPFEGIKRRNERRFGRLLSEKQYNPISKKEFSERISALTEFIQDKNDIINLPPKLLNVLSDEIGSVCDATFILEHRSDDVLRFDVFENPDTKDYFMVTNIHMTRASINIRIEGKDGNNIDTIILRFNDKTFEWLEDVRVNCYTDNFTHVVASVSSKGFDTFLRMLEKKACVSHSFGCLPETKTSSTALRSEDNMKVATVNCPTLEETAAYVYAFMSAYMLKMYSYY